MNWASQKWQRERKEYLAFHWTLVEKYKQCQIPQRKANANKAAHFFFHLPSQPLTLPLIKKSQHKHVLRGWFSIATTSQVTDIRTIDKSHTAPGGNRGKKREQVSCLPERSYHLESCSDSCHNISKHTGHPEINEAPLKPEMINVTWAPTFVDEPKNNPNWLHFIILGQLVPFPARWRQDTWLL